MKNLDMKVKAEGQLPSYGTDYSAGMDIYCNNSEKIVLKKGEMAKVETGLRVEIPQGFFGAVYPRSSAGTKLRVALANTTGIIDSDYRGEIKLFIVNQGENEVEINKGDRLVQMVIQPYIKVNIIEVDELTESERGNKGFGSTGR